MNPTSHPAPVQARIHSVEPRFPQPKGTARQLVAPGDQPREARATQRITTRSTASVRIVLPQAIFDTPALLPGTAQIKLQLQPRTDAELVTFAEGHAAALVDNPLFPQPVPSADDFDTRLAAFEAILAEVENLRVQLLNLTQQKDQLRRELEATFNQRAAYIQLVSQGNPDAIASAGLSTRRPRIRTGTLPPPENLIASVTQIPGQLLLTWETVRGVRSFQLECALLTDGEPPQWTTLYIGGQLRYLATDLTPGQRYAFRLATIGGKDGRSTWSPVVERMVA